MMIVKTRTVGEIVLGREPYLVFGETAVLDVARYMADRQVGAVPVVGEQGRLLGIFSERDLLARVVTQGLDPATIKVSEVMTRRVAVLDVESSRRQHGMLHQAPESFLGHGVVRVIPFHGTS